MVIYRIKDAVPIKKMFKFFLKNNTDGQTDTQSVKQYNPLLFGAGV